ncbi:uncharacterized protein LOC144547600 [Carex rostrata]
MDPDKQLLYTKDYFPFPYDLILTSKLQTEPWKNGVEQEFFANNYRCLFVRHPRFYSCHFCDREFHSSQALGGHMNIHRRDRAKLRQGLHLDPNEGHITSTLHASTFKRSNSSDAMGGLIKRASISSRDCTLSLSNSSSIIENRVGFRMKDQITKDDPVIINAKRRRVDTLIETQDQDVDLELRL